jgi:hypothetical protein
VRRGKYIRRKPVLSIILRRNSTRQAHWSQELQEWLCGRY